MKTQELNNEELLNIGGGAATRSAGITGTIGADSLLSLTSESTNGNDYHKTSISTGSGFSLNLLGLKRNYNEY